MYGKQPKKFENKLNQNELFTVADNFNCSPFLGRKVGRLPCRFCGQRKELWPKEQQRNWAVSFQAWLIINFCMHFSIFLPPSAVGCRWGWGLKNGHSIAWEESGFLNDHMKECSLPKVNTHPISDVGNIMVYCWNLWSYVVIEHKPL